MRTGAERIAAERERQIVVHGWDHNHDDKHVENEMVKAAYCYLRHVDAPIQDHPTGLSHLWPWHSSWWKPSVDPIRNLEKAGALIAAEIDRLLRVQAQNG